MGFTLDGFAVRVMAILVLSLVGVRIGPAGSPEVDLVTSFNIYLYSTLFARLQGEVLHGSSTCWEIRPQLRHRGGLPAVSIASRGRFDHGD